MSHRAWSAGALGLAIAGVILTAAAPAPAYVRSRTDTDQPLFWNLTAVSIKAYPAGFSQLPAGGVGSAVISAAAAWSRQHPDLASCSYLDIRAAVAADSEPRPRAANDRVNNLRFLETSWCPDDAEPDGCYDPDALALTLVTAVISTGQLVDADIEVNAVSFAWGDVAADPAAMGRHDLQNALTHEMGHFIGLDHTCWIDPSLPRQIDHTGVEVPPCLTAPPVVQETTMFASARPGQVEQRTLAADDRAGVCAIYPRGSEPAEEDGCGCALSPRDRGGIGGGLAALALALGAAAAVARRRRAWRSRSRRSKRNRGIQPPGNDVERASAHSGGSAK